MSDRFFVFYDQNETGQTEICFAKYLIIYIKRQILLRNDALQASTTVRFYLGVGSRQSQAFKTRFITCHYPWIRLPKPEKCCMFLNVCIDTPSKPRTQRASTQTRAGALSSAPSSNIANYCCLISYPLTQRNRNSEKRIPGLERVNNS